MSCVSFIFMPLKTKAVFLMEKRGIDETGGEKQSLTLQCFVDITTWVTLDSCLVSVFYTETASNMF